MEQRHFVSSTGQFRDTFLDLSAWGKGVAFINGFNLGWYWPSIGPQNHYYVPGPLLKDGNNSIVLLEMEDTPDDLTGLLALHSPGAVCSFCDVTTSSRKSTCLWKSVRMSNLDSFIQYWKKLSQSTMKTMEMSLTEASLATENSHMFSLTGVTCLIFIHHHACLNCQCSLFCERILNGIITHTVSLVEDPDLRGPQGRVHPTWQKVPEGFGQLLHQISGQWQKKAWH